MTPQEKIIAFHYSHTWPSGKTVFFEFEDAIVVFSVPANPYVAKWFGLGPRAEKQNDRGRVITRATKTPVWELTRLWAPNGHRPNLLTEAISHAMGEFTKLDEADIVVSYCDPEAVNGNDVKYHHGGIYRAASWTYLGVAEEGRAWRDEEGQIHPRRKFHSGHGFLTDEYIRDVLGYVKVKVPGKLRFARGITRAGKRAVAAKEAEFIKEQIG